MTYDPKAGRNTTIAWRNMWAYIGQGHGGPENITPEMLYHAMEAASIPTGPLAAAPVAARGGLESKLPR